MPSDSPHDHSELKAAIALFPALPGVYIMRDAKGEVIYIGKAKNLKLRVRSYFGKGDGRAQVEFLVKRVQAIEKIVTASENQACVLERDLINKYKPRYNIRLKDDKSYLSIRVDEHSKWPRLELVRKIESDGVRYFGPYSYSYELRALLDIIKRVVPLRTCTDTVFYNRQRPCLEYQIKRCAGPCCLAVDREVYGGWVKQAIAILEGRTDFLVKDLEEQMLRASKELRYEDAAAMRDRLEVLKNFKKGQAFISSRGEDRDVFSLYREGSLAAVSVLNVRFGRISGNANFSLSNVELSNEQVLESVVAQFYEGGREIPDEVIIPFEFENLSMVRDALKIKRDGPLDITAPSRGIKLRLIRLAEVNAKQHFIGVFNSEARYTEVATEIAKQFKLRQMPRRIECVDISNLQGSDIVGAVVSFFDGEPDKSRYRKYKIKGAGKPDDFAAIYEVMHRRLTAAKSSNDFPDLIIVDGGPGQLGAALRAKADVDIGVDVVSLAKIRSLETTLDGRDEKKPERVYIAGLQQPLPLEPGKSSTHFIQRVRDEAHRFVITFHRSSRKQRVIGSVLDKIPGIGVERRKRLLREFGSISKLKEVEPTDLARVGRMPLSLGLKLKAILSDL